MTNPIIDKIMLSPIPIRPKINADLAAVGLSSFHTKNIIIPKMGIQHKDKILTGIFALSSTVFLEISLFISKI